MWRQFIIRISFGQLSVRFVSRFRVETHEIFPNLRVGHNLVMDRLEVLLGRVPVAAVRHEHVVEWLLVLLLQLVHSHL